ncbi:hypothetical protein EST38_g4432 [Candolleomyces aberdarensis]|uniref:Uncharacterized protein n=1 Tax=Candolleomyces aberdarensis TaxID=2316362 RepID=A0A4Q2DN61_9AGAR|nr:hypothetical protein EST38_g4432 [Candolleomyces aberdarensis]
MRFTIAACATFLSVLSIFPIANAQPSPQASCFECPSADDGLNILLSSSLPDPTTGEFSCAYAGGGTCVYLGLQGQGGDLVSGTEFCPSAAVDICLARRQRMKERALPRSPRPPSPAAFVPKPNVMKTRKILRESKAKSREASYH